MSLVGTRPPTLDEWEKYELHHRARLAIKPGITGMWQVSGRSDITDFEEVVKLPPLNERNRHNVTVNKGGQELILVFSSAFHLHTILLMGGVLNA